jgi:hypothetical protein
VRWAVWSHPVCIERQIDTRFLSTSRRLGSEPLCSECRTRRRESSYSASFVKGPSSSVSLSSSSSNSVCRTPTQVFCTSANRGSSSCERANGKVSFRRSFSAERQTDRESNPELSRTLGFILDDDEVVDDLPTRDPFVDDHLRDGGEREKQPRGRQGDSARWCTGKGESENEASGGGEL